MSDYVNIGPTPCGESCAQIGSPDFYEKARKECNIFKRQLQRMFPKVVFRVKSFPHDFGTYYEVIAVYDLREGDSEFAYEAENNAPEYWDAKAKEELSGEFKENQIKRV